MQSRFTVHKQIPGVSLIGCFYQFRFWNIALKSGSGFSLFEMIAVLLVLGIISAVAAPRFAGAWVHSKQVTLANQLASQIDYARRHAMNTGRNAILKIDEAADSLRVNVPRPGRIENAVLINIKEEYDSSFELTANFDGARQVQFDFEGTPIVDAAPLLEGVISVSSGSTVYEIHIAPGTGKTTIVKAESRS